MTHLETVSNFLQSMQNGYVDITVDGNDLANKKPISEITLENGTVKSYLKRIQEEHKNSPAIIITSIKTGNAFKRVSSEVLLPEVQTAPVNQPTPALPAAPPPSLGNPYQASQSAAPAKESIWRDKYDHLKELYEDQKETLKDVRRRNEDLIEENRKLRVQVDTADEKHKIDLLKTELSNKQSLNGLITDATKPETISAIKELVLAMKMKDAPAQSAPKQGILEGISDAQMKMVIESNVKLLASLDMETVSKLVYINDVLANPENAEALDAVFNQITNQSK